jgi:hypothetical protein
MATEERNRPVCPACRGPIGFGHSMCLCSGYRTIPTAHLFENYKDICEEIMSFYTPPR